MCDSVFANLYYRLQAELDVLCTRLVNAAKEALPALTERVKRPAGQIWA